MKISHSWLTDFVELDSSEWTPQRISTVLTDLGLEVEHIDDQAAELDRFVVGRVLTCEKHPKADKLSVTTVDAGEPEPRTIVCGAPNVAAGQLVPVALDGAVIPGADFTIGKRKLRGIESNGMICSQAELGAGEDSDGIWVFDDEQATPGTPLAEYLGHTDVVYDIFNTPNRADCNSHVGVARELKAFMTSEGLSSPERSDGDLLGMTDPRHSVPGMTNGDLPSFTTGLVDPSPAPRYALRRINGVAVKESPQWMQDRLRAVGLRPRNIIVDVTNYVNMELGQPLHAFDFNKLRGGTIEVHTVSAQKFVTLDDKERTLDENMLMICDGEGPIAIAGVMGGQNSEIDDATTDIVLESAYFDPSSIRKTAKKLGLSTDASYRFERGVDIGNVMGALDRATELILEHAGGTPASEVDLYPSPVQPQPIKVRYQKMRDINGIDVSDERIREMCASIGCDVKELDDSACEVVAPTWRVDLGVEIDIAEEIMRLFGINNVPANEVASVSLAGAGLDSSVQAGGSQERLQKRRELRTLLQGRGYADCVTSVLTSPELSSFGGEEPALLKNALGKEFSALRTSILPGLVGVASRNLRHGADAVRVFDIGSTFHLQNTSEFGIDQREHLVVLVCGRREQHWSLSDRSLDLFDMLGDLAVLGAVHFAPLVDRTSGLWTENAVSVMVNGTVVGVAGEVHPNLAKAFDVEVPVFAAEIDVRAIPIEQQTYVPVAQYPSVQRDLAMIVEEGVTAGEIISVITKAASDTFQGAQVFDVFRDNEHVGENKKSVAVAMVFRSNERTLVDDEVDASMKAIIKAAEKNLNAHVRGNDVINKGGGVGMAQRPEKGRAPLRAVSGKQKPEESELPAGMGESDGGEDISIQKIWELVRKSTDIIVALREENAILRNEVSSLRKSETTLQDRIQDFLGRIETLERVQYAEPDVPARMSAKQIDRLEDSMKPEPRQPQGPPPATGSKVTITITVENDGSVNVDNTVRAKNG